MVFNNTTQKSLTRISFISFGSSCHNFFVGKFFKFFEVFDKTIRQTGLKAYAFRSFQQFIVRNIIGPELEHPGRDPRERVITVAYYALVQLEGHNLQAATDARNTAWFSLDDLPNLAFDHQKILDAGLHRLKGKVRYQPIGFELLPPKFTMPQLLKLYEEIYQKKLDDRNFRKKIKALNFLKQLDEKDKSNSKKGAFYYSFDKKKYALLLEKGVNVDLK